MTAATGPPVLRTRTPSRSCPGASPARTMERVLPGATSRPRLPGAWIWPFGTVEVQADGRRGAGGIGDVQDGRTAEGRVRADQPEIVAWLLAGRGRGALEIPVLGSVVQDCAGGCLAVVLRIGAEDADVVHRLASYDAGDQHGRARRGRRGGGRCCSLGNLHERGALERGEPAAGNGTCVRAEHGGADGGLRCGRFRAELGVGAHRCAFEQSGRAGAHPDAASGRHRGNRCLEMPAGGALRCQ